MQYCPEENFNVLRDAIYRIEGYLGLRGDTGTNSPLTVSDRVYLLENPFETASITPTNTNVVDTVDTTEFASRKWIIDYETTDGLVRTVEVLARVNPTSPNTAIYNIYSILGDSIPESTTVVMSGTDMQLKITNNHTQTLNVKAYILKAK